MPHTDSDREGIVMAIVLDGRGGARHVGWGDVDAWTPEHGALWLQLDATSPRATAWLESQGEGLATLSRDDRKPRFEAIDDQTIRFGVRAWLPTLRQGARGQGVTNLWLQPMRAVVVSRGLLAELPEIGDRLAKGVGPATIPALAIEQLSDVAGRLTEAVADLEQPIADLDYDTVTGPGDPEALRRLGLQIVDLRRYLTPLRVVVDRLIADRPMWLVGDVLPRLTTIAEDLRSDEAEAEHLLERVGTMREFIADRRAARMNDILYVLTIVSTIMLPLTFITGVFGMNFEFMPLIHRSWGFALSVVGMLLIVSAMLGYFRYKRWL